MGGTGLEPVTPSLSIPCSRSTPFAQVRSTSTVEPNGQPTERLSEPERTRLLAILATPPALLQRMPVALFQTRRAPSIST